MPSQFGRYELLERISLGGMAEVFRAQVAGAAGFEKIVAIKRILPQYCDDERFVSMFIEEARISANLSHANIAQVYDFGQIDGRFYLAMEYVPGKDLASLQLHFRARGQQMPIPMAIRVGLDVAAALHYAHTKRDPSGELLYIVHRDVSPPNVIVAFDGCVKLIDFGIAKALSRSKKTATGQLKGKLGYLSPEQAEGAEIDGRSDLFSLGTLLFELLTGLRLFSAESELGVVMAVRRAEVPSITSLNQAVPEDLEAIVRRALARDPRNRFQSAEELYGALEDLSKAAGLSYSNMQLARWMSDVFSPSPELSVDSAVTKRGRAALPAALRDTDPEPETRRCDDSASLAAEMLAARRPPAEERQALDSLFEEDSTTDPRGRRRASRESSHMPVGTMGDDEETTQPSSEPGIEQQVASDILSGTEESRTPAAAPVVPSDTGPKLPEGRRSGYVGRDLTPPLVPATVSGPMPLLEGSGPKLAPEKRPVSKQGSGPKAVTAEKPSRATVDSVDSEVDTLRPGRRWTGPIAGLSDEEEPPTAPGTGADPTWEGATEEATDPEAGLPTETPTVAAVPTELVVRMGLESMEADAATTVAEPSLPDRLDVSPGAAISDLNAGGSWDEPTPDVDRLRMASHVMTLEKLGRAPQAEAAPLGQPSAPVWDDLPTTVHLAGDETGSMPDGGRATPAVVVAHLKEEEVPLPSDLDATHRDLPSSHLGAHMEQSAQLLARESEISRPGHYLDEVTTASDVKSTVALRELSTKDSGSFPTYPNPTRRSSGTLRGTPATEQGYPSPEMRRHKGDTSEVAMSNSSTMSRSARAAVPDELPSYLTPRQRTGPGRWIIVVLLFVMVLAAAAAIGVLLLRRTNIGPVWLRELVATGSSGSAVEPHADAGARAPQRADAVDAGREADGRSAPLRTARPQEPAAPTPDRAEQAPPAHRDQAEQIPADPTKVRKRPHRASRRRPKARASLATGYLVISSKPWARVIVDGKDTGRNTPVTPAAPLQVKAGRRKVTLLTGGKRFDFSVEVKDGQTAKLIQVLPIKLEESEP